MPKRAQFSPIAVPPSNDSTFYIPEVANVVPTDTGTETIQPDQREKRGGHQTSVDLAEPQLLPGVGEILTVPLDRIKDSPYQTREEIDELKYKQLIYSIKTLKQRIILFVCRDPEDEGYYFPMMGGHIRKMAAKEAGLTKIPVILIDYDRQALGLGTAQENLGRQDLNIIEKGKLFLLLRKDFKWSQERLAAELGIDGVGRDYIASCEIAAKDAPDIQRMLMIKKDGGIRAASYFRRLDAFCKEQPGKAEQMRASIIESFLNEEISTDEVRIRVERIMNSDGQTEVPTEDKVPFVKRFEKIEATKKSFQRFSRLMGEESPTEEERNVLTALRSDIDAILERP